MKGNRQTNGPDHPIHSSTVCLCCFKIKLSTSHAWITMWPVHGQSAFKCTYCTCQTEHKYTYQRLRDKWIVKSIFQDSDYNGSLQLTMYASTHFLYSLGLYLQEHLCTVRSNTYAHTVYNQDFHYWVWSDSALVLSHTISTPVYTQVAEPHALNSHIGCELRYRCVQDVPYECQTKNTHKLRSQHNYTKWYTHTCE